MTTPALQPGLLVLHGNRAELLAEALFEWLGSHPLAPLEEEVFLVQSNGMAEWLKMALAARAGICAATRVELPGRFLWRAWRQVLGREQVLAQSATDKSPLAWRLMALLPQVALQPGYEPLAGFLRDADADADADRVWQLAQRLADLYDQYQVYRSDWLATWAEGHDVLLQHEGQPPATAPRLDPGQRWQAALWRALLAPLPAVERDATRSQLHRRFLAALAAGPAAGTVPRRVVLFGMTHLPLQTLTALAALSRHSQVLLAIPNPCRYHWADTLDGRELLRTERRRQPLRGGRDLASLALDEMHAHAHPLLAAWGRQGRDFVRQLDAFDDALAMQQRFAIARVDLFDDGPGLTLLEQVQGRIRDLVPLAEHAALAAAPPGLQDRSIVFHIAHSAQREVEVLHDQLLELLARPPGGQPLNPRDIVVMVPAIEGFAPAIRSVFGQHPRHDRRHIPFDIADMQERGNNPLLVALDWLLRLPQQRCRASEVRDLLDVPAVARRFGLAAEDAPRLARWVEGAGIRWGLDAAQRGALGLAACGGQNSWRFGLDRMLLGYAGGEAGAAWDDIEPYAEIGGLEASVVGTVAAVLQALTQWWADTIAPASPSQWAERGRRLLAAFVAPTDERERLTLAALHDALAAWLDACDTAGFDAAVPLSVAREAWLAGVDAPGLAGRFRAGGVTFCTLLPMRAIPFDVVCLLGMNEGDYPRSSARSDFDLMGRPGQVRPGDRARRDDDRQLMLEALLSARRVLSVSWSGRSVRDNSVQPPSVLVSQLRDYLAAGWPGDVLGPRTTEHPLQPFSRRYFEVARPIDGEAVPPALFTHAHEWRAAHLPAADATVAGGPAAAPSVPWTPDPAVALTIAGLARFLKRPVHDHFRARLDVVFPANDADTADDEAFTFDGLQSWRLHDEILQGLLADLQPRFPDAAETALSAAALQRAVASRVARLRRSGRLPIGELGVQVADALAATLVPVLRAWQTAQARCPHVLPQQALRWSGCGVTVDDWLTGLRTAQAPGEAPAPVWFELVPGVLCTSPKNAVPLAGKLVTAWVRTLVAGACGLPVGGLLVGRDAAVALEPVAVEEAAARLADLVQAWQDNMRSPLPLASRTALAQVAAATDVAAVYEGDGQGQGGEGEEACLARVYPDFAALVADGRFEALAGRLFGPLHAWAKRATASRHTAESPGDDRDA